MNNDLISREALKEAIISICGNCSNIIREYKDGVPDGNCAIQHIMNIIDNAPTVELTDLQDAYEQGYAQGWKERFGEPKHFLTDEKIEKIIDLLETEWGYEGIREDVLRILKGE